jgi:serine/threonine protein kinase
LAIKQVVCSDLKAANQAISEIFTIHNLKHDNLIDYRKLFLTSTNNNLQLCGLNFKKILKLFQVNVVMPFYSQGDLEGYISSLYKKNSTLPEKDLIDFSLQILQCIAYLHKNKGKKK